MVTKILPSASRKRNRANAHNSPRNQGCVIVGNHGFNPVLGERLTNVIQYILKFDCSYQLQFTSS